MFNKTFDQALLRATYKNGKIGTRTDAHEAVEYHHFKTGHLFKRRAVVSKELYTSFLIQQLLIIKAIETKLDNLSPDKKFEINAFFTLSYLEKLWRTKAMEQDLRGLGVDPETIQGNKIAKTTQTYITSLDKLTPKTLLAHFLLHVAGFMHGGSAICSRYIRPSNKQTAYQILTNQYDFTSTGMGGIALYKDMMRQVDNISLSEEEYHEVFKNCISIYETMTHVFDDLYQMHIHQPVKSGSKLPILAAVIITLGILVNLINNAMSLEKSFLCCHL